MGEGGEENALKTNNFVRVSNRRGCRRFSRHSAMAPEQLFYTHTFVQSVCDTSTQSVLEAISASTIPFMFVGIGS